MPLLLAIIADDLTGALDAAAPFAARGLRVCVALGPSHLGAALARDPQVIAVTTDSREIGENAARDAMRQVVQALPPVRIFKKVDSRLKGNIAAELSELHFDRALLVPAIPEFGRIQTGGFVRGFGVTQPISMSDVLGHHAAKAQIPDITTPQQMHDVLDAADYDLLIGARGLADALAQKMTGRSMVMLDTLPGPRALFVIGSRDPITLEQAAALRDLPDTVTVDAPNGQVESLPDAPRILVQAQPGMTEVTGPQVAAALATAVAPLLRAGFGAALLTGGATAQACLQHIGAQVLDLRGECLPGLVAADTDGLTIVTKSGGFGNRNSLSQIAAMIGRQA